MCNNIEPPNSVGFDLMKTNSKITGKVGYVPGIIVDGVASEDAQHQPEFNLSKYVCKVYKVSVYQMIATQYLIHRDLFHH